jgi:hypothetical protein
MRFRTLCCSFLSPRPIFHSRTPAAVHASSVDLTMLLFNPDLTNGGTEAQEPAVCTARSRLQLGCTLTPAACTARSARSVPGQDTRSGQGALARRHTDGPLWAALLKTTVMCEAWRRHTVAAPNPSRTADRPKPNSPYNWVLDTDTGTGPIPSITVSKVNAYSGGVLARALPEGLRYLST